MLQCKWNSEIYEKPILRNKTQKNNNYIDNPTVKRIVLFERGNKSKNDWEVFTWGKNSIVIMKRVVLKSEGDPENKSFSFVAKF